MRHFRLESILLYLHRISVFTQNLGQTPNFFAAELLLEDGKVLECLSEHTFFETAKMLYVPAALLDYKFSLLHEKGELVNSMYIRKADFLKEDLHAYDNDIGYGDI